MGTTVIYARVSTEDQTLEQQEQDLWKYTTERIDVDANNIEVLRDKSTGTDIDHSGYREMMQLVRDGTADRVVVRAIDRIGLDVRDIHETIYEIVDDHGCDFHATQDGLHSEGEDMDIDFQSALSGFSLAAEIRARKVKHNTIQAIQGLRAAEEAGKWAGRPPYGFWTDEDGYLQPTEEFSTAVDAIKAVEQLGWSHRRTARHTGIPRRTVPNILERKDLYLSETEA